MSSFDIIVVGGGGTGLMAAYAAACEGRSVVVLEKGEKLGGTTGLSVGTVTAAGTALQRAAGIHDDADAHFEDMGKFAGSRANRDNLELRRLLVDHGADTISLLAKLGVVFMGPLPEPPHRHPRMHAIIPHSRGFIDRLAEAGRRKGVVYRTGAQVEKLVETDGRVGGVALAGGEVLAARRGVILSSGDFSSARDDYKSKYMSGPLLDIGGINPLSTGDGQRMGEAVGGEVVNGDLAWGPEIRFKAPEKKSFVAGLPSSPTLARVILAAMKIMPQALIRPFLLAFVTTYLAPAPALFRKGAILVNAAGARFCDECDRPQDHIGRQPGKSAWIVFGASVAAAFQAWPNFISTAPGVGFAYLSDYERTRPDVVRKADTLDDLARLIAVPGDALRRSVADYNAALPPDGERAPIEAGPFYALGPAISWIVFSEGGLRIDRDFRVLHRDGGPIRGLYAAGSAGQGGLLLEGHGHHLAWAFTSGRLAGRNAALAEA
ncbi:MAG: FAD-dependent oxidoreductase [Hyphomicrobiaceae bacterium]